MIPLTNNPTSHETAASSVPKEPHQVLSSTDLKFCTLENAAV